MYALCVAWNSIRSRLIINLIFSIWQKHRMKCFLREMASHLHNLNWHLFNVTIVCMCMLYSSRVSLYLKRGPFLNAYTHFNDSKSIGNRFHCALGIFENFHSQNESFTIAKRVLCFFSLSPLTAKSYCCRVDFSWPLHVNGARSFCSNRLFWKRLP